MPFSVGCARGALQPAGWDDWFGPFAAGRFATVPSATTWLGLPVKPGTKMPARGKSAARRAGFVKCAKCPLKDATRNAACTVSAYRTPAHFVTRRPPCFPPTSPRWISGVIVWRAHGWRLGHRLLGGIGARASAHEIPEPGFGQNEDLAAAFLVEAIHR